MKVLLEQKNVTYTEVEIEFPFYAMVVENESTDIYVKIEEEWFTQIRFDAVETSVSRYRCKCFHIAELWYTNKCTKEEYNNAVKALKDIVNTI